MTAKRQRTADQNAFIHFEESLSMGAAAIHFEIMGGKRTELEKAHGKLFGWKSGRKTILAPRPAPAGNVNGLILGQTS